MKRFCAAWVILVPMLLHADDWKLVWSDEFDRPGLPDPAKWGYEEGFVRNNEAQFYTAARKENARVEAGFLILEARKERFPNPKFETGSKNPSRNRSFAEFTSASLTTKAKASWTYGRVEVRAQVPKGRGTWPAIWMLGTNITQVGWPRCGEIDIMEFVGFQPDTIHANVHTAKYNHTKKTGRGDRLVVPDAPENFHRYALEWSPERLDFFVDDTKYFTCPNDKGGDDSWPFDRDHFLILNLAIGGAWGGQKGIDSAIFPAQFRIDYVRVYQKPAA